MHGGDLMVRFFFNSPRPLPFPANTETILKEDFQFPSRPTLSLGQFQRAFDNHAFTVSHYHY
jgi:hypothetical protein